MLWIIIKFLWWIIGVHCWTFMQTEQELLLTSACLGRCWLACGFYLWWKQSMDACWLVAFASITYANVARVSPCVFSLHAFVEIVHSFVCTPSLTLSVCLCLRCGTLKNTRTHTHTHTHLAVSKHPDTQSPSVCIMFLALPLFLFAGRAKAEPARQTTTKRRKRKNSASSANSSVGTTAGKKRSPATNFSLSSQVPVSISSVCLFSSTFFLWLNMSVLNTCTDGPNGIADWFIVHWREGEEMWEKTPRSLYSETKESSRDV